MNVPILILIGVIVVLVVLVDRDLQRSRPAAAPGRRGVRPDRGPAQAPPRPDPEPRERGQGLHGLRAGGPDRRHQGPRRRRRRRRPGSGPAGPGREHAHRRPALAVRGRRELPGPEGQPERPRAPGAADHDGEPDLVLAASTTTRRVLDYNTAIATFPNVLARGPVRLHPSASSSTPSPRRPRSRRSTSALSRRSSGTAAATAPGLSRTWLDLLRADRPPTGGTAFLLALVVVLLLGAARVRGRLRADRRPRGRRSGRPRSRVVVGLVIVAWARTSRATSSCWPRPARKRGRRDGRAAADERRPGDGDRGEHADAEGLHHRRHRAERLRHGPRPEARLDRDHDRAAREARPRGAPGRHRPRAVARPQPRHPVLADRRRARRLDRAAGRLLPALHLLGRRRGAAAIARAAVALQAIFFVARHRPGGPRADRRPARPARRQPAARVPRRRVVGAS